MGSDIEPLSIVKYPDPVLLEVAAPIAEINDDIRALAREMIGLMIAHDGAGLAANQVGRPVRMIVAFVRHNSHAPSMPGKVNSTFEPTVYINPRIVSTAGPHSPLAEGCLSQPGRRVIVRRPLIVRMEYQALDGQHCAVDGYGFLTRVWQHEIDHLNGINIGQATRRAAGAVPVK